MDLEKKINEIMLNLNAIQGFNPDIFLEFINDMVQARSTAYYTDEKKQRYLNLNFTEASQFVNPAANSGRSIKTSMILSNLRSAKNENVAIGGSNNYF